MYCASALWGSDTPAAAHAYIVRPEQSNDVGPGARVDVRLAELGPRRCRPRPGPSRSARARCRASLRRIGAVARAARSAVGRSSVAARSRLRGAARPCFAPRVAIAARGGGFGSRLRVRRASRRRVSRSCPSPARAVAAAPRWPASISCVRASSVIALLLAPRRVARSQRTSVAGRAVRSRPSPGRAAGDPSRRPRRRTPNAMPSSLRVADVERGERRGIAGAHVELGAARRRARPAPRRVSCWRASSWRWSAPICSSACWIASCAWLYCSSRIETRLPLASICASSCVGLLRVSAARSDSGRRVREPSRRRSANIAARQRERRGECDRRARARPSSSSATWASH